jgi:hypothetical protein
VEEGQQVRHLDGGEIALEGLLHGKARILARGSGPLRDALRAPRDTITLAWARRTGLSDLPLFSRALPGFPREDS